MPVEDVNSQPNAQILCVPKSRSLGHDVLVQLREAAAAPSPLAQFLQDPAVIELSRLKRTKGGHKGSRKTPSITQLALVEEERKIGHLKALLQSAADHLEYEIRRADEGELRAHYAEIHEKQVSAQLMAAESSRSQTEGEKDRSVAESQRYQIELESAGRELQSLKGDFRRMEKLKDEFEEASMKAEELNRYFQNKLLKYRMREDGMEQGRQIEMVRCFDEGLEEGWTEGNEEGFEEGRKRGYEEGRKVGRKEGLSEGSEQGRMEERRKALEAFDRFLNEEMGGYDDDRSARIRKWTESIYHSSSAQGSTFTRL